MALQRLPDNGPRWNLFAAILEEILRKQGKQLSTLYGYREWISPEKVRRLQRSLQGVMSFPVLTPEELEQLMRTFGLNLEEELRLRAAVLATAVEAKLMDRILPEKALTAAW